MSFHQILIVDDETDLREAVGEMLGLLGYSTLGVPGGAEAVDVIEKKAETVDLVLLDAHMPGLNGTETFQRIREVAPDIPVVFITGDPDAVNSGDEIAAGAFAVLGKPFGMKELGQVVREALEVRAQS